MNEPYKFKGDYTRDTIWIKEWVTDHYETIGKIHFLGQDTLGWYRQPKDRRLCDIAFSIYTTKRCGETGHLTDYEEYTLKKHH